MAEAKPKKARASKSAPAQAVDVFAEGNQPVAASHGDAAVVQPTTEPATTTVADAASPTEDEAPFKAMVHEMGLYSDPDPVEQESGAVPDDPVVTEAELSPTPRPAPPQPPASPPEPATRPAKAKRYRCVEACRFRNQSWEVGDILPPTSAKTAIPSFFEAVE
ncbi:MAG: hypothetical protein LIP77_01750 [Planctomycetes bacterium]|nr:hypothetical protein [Planctomycetota bacterium]